MSIKTTLYSILFVIVLLGVICIYIFFKPEKNILKLKPDYKLTAIELFNEYSINEEAANTKFLGKIIQVRGTIREISAEDSIYTTIILETEDIFFGVNCVLNDKYATQPKEILIGSEATIKGECSGILIDVVLNNCVLIDE